jgi:hypothetical protein
MDDIADNINNNQQITNETLSNIFINNADSTFLAE